MKSHSNRWTVVNTMHNQLLDPGIIGRMDARVCKYYGHTARFDGEAPRQEELNIFLLETEKEFKFGKGKALVAIADGGKNKVGHDIKYVRWYNLYGKDPDNSKNKLKIMDKTYTYGVSKAREFWDEKIKEGYDRVK